MNFTLPHMQFTVYILWSASMEKSYVGMTSNLQNRLYAHNYGIKGWTVRGRPWELIHSENYDTKMQAENRERFLKTGVGREYIQKTILVKLKG